MSAACLGGFTIDPYPVDTTHRQRARTRRVSTSSIASESDIRRKIVIDQLLELRRLGNDWDGDGAVAPLPELIDSAIDLINQTQGAISPSRIVPVNDGRITLEWERNGDFVSLRVDAPYQARQMIIKPDGTTEFCRISWPR